MSLNINVWGEPTIFSGGHSADMQTEEYKKYCFMYGNIDSALGYVNSTLAGAIRMGRIEKYGMDLSPAYCASDSEFCMNNGKFVECYYNKGDRERIDWTTKPKSKTPIMLHIMVDTYTPSYECYMYPENSSIFKNFFYTPYSNIVIPSSVSDTYYQNTNVGFNPYVQIPMQSIVFLTAVCCCDVKPPVTEATSGYNQQYWFDLDCYCNGTTTDGLKVYEKYPYIMGVAVFPFVYRSVYGITENERSGWSGPMYIQHYGNYIENELIYDNVPYKDINNMCQCKTTPEKNVYNILTQNKDGIASHTNLFSSVYTYGTFIWGDEQFQIAGSRSGAWYYYISGSGDNRLKIEESEISTATNKPIFQYTVISDFENIKNFYDFFMKQTAYIGLFFTPKLNVAFSGNLNDDDMYLGIIDDSGITHGTYSKGADNESQAQYKWTDAISQTPYDPTKKPDPSIYDEETKLNTGRLFTVGANVFTNMYALSRMTTFDLRQYLYSVVAPESTSETNTKQFLTNNPIDCIVGCYQYPFNVIPDAGSTAEPIRLGNTNAKSTAGSDLSGYIITDCLRLLDFGSVEYYPFFGDFRDYEPYSEALLYIPYVGYIPLSPSEFMTHNIGVKLIVDLATGSCNALIYKDGLVIQTANGTIGLQIPITGIQQADLSNAIHNAEYQSKMALASTVGSMATSTIAGFASGATGNIAGVAASLANIATTTTTGALTLENAEYNLQHTKVPFKVSGTASPACSFDNEQQCRLILKRPVMDESYNPALYGRSVGFACLITATLLSFTGYTQVSSVDVSGIEATSEEKKMIQQLLQSGVYL